jgi:hypothetical protein
MPFRLRGTTFNSMEQPCIPSRAAKVTGIEGMRNDNINAAGAIIDPTKFTTVWVDISCKGG